MTTGADDTPDGPTIGASGLTLEFLSNRSSRSPAPDVELSFTAPALGDAVLRVTAADVREALNELYDIEIELNTPDPSLDLDLLLGARAVLVASRGPRHRRFCGIVRRVEPMESWGDRRRVRVWLVPVLWTLSQRSDCRIFQGLSAVQIVQKILRDADLTADALSVDLRREYPVREYCVQYRETDLAFVMRLLEDEGITFFFRHEHSEEQLVLVDSPSFGLVPTLDRRAVPFAPPQSDRAPVEVVHRLGLTRELRPTGVTLRDYDFTRPTSEVDLTRARPRGDAGPRALYDYPGEFTLGDYSVDGQYYTEHDGSRRAEVRHLEALTPERHAAGSGNVTGFMPGRVFELLGHEHPSLDQRYLLTSVVHRFRAPEELLSGASRAGEARSEEPYRNTFECTPASVAWTPPRRTPRPAVLASQTATVVGPPGEEIHVDFHGRIKVQFHWDRRGKRDHDSSCWIRVAQTWSGAGWGTHFTPRVGMEVVVTFLEGNPDRPLVIGCVPNGSNSTPYLLPDMKTRSTIRSNSTPGGNGYNELRFEDLRGHEQVFVHAQRDLDEEVRRQHTIKTGEDELITIGANQITNIANVQRINVGADRFTMVEKSDHESVLDDQELIVEGARTRVVVKDETVTVHGHRTMNVHHGETRVVRGGSSTVVHPMPPPPPGHPPPKDDDGHFANSTSIHGNQLTQIHGREHVEINDRKTYVGRHDELKIEKDYVINVGESANLLVGDLAEPGKSSTGYYIAADTVRLGGTSTDLNELSLLRESDSMTFTPDAITVESHGRDIVIQIAGTGTHIKISGDGEDIEICAKSKITLRAAKIALSSGG